MKRRPRILFVSPRLPFPLNQGLNIRISNILRALAEVGEVDAVCAVGLNRLRRLSDAPVAVPDWCAALTSLRLVAVPPWKAEDPIWSRNSLARRLVAREPISYSTFPVAPLQDRLRQLAKVADMVWIERLFLAQPMAGLNGRVVVDLDDLESVRLYREAATVPSRYLRWVMRREAGRLAAAESRAPLQFARVAVCSPQDARLFPAAADRVWVVPNGVDDSLLHRAPRPRVRNRLVFVGGMAYLPNEQAVLYFVRQILPRIRAAVPDVSLAIVGLNPPKTVRELHDRHTVSVHADVPDVAPFVQEAAVSVVPLLVGGGTRLKILESLALGTPVVSTTVGAEGLDLDDNEHLLLADSPEDFAAAVVRLMRDGDTSRRIAQRGQKRVAERYLWSAIRAAVASRVLELTGTQGPAALPASL